MRVTRAAPARVTRCTYRLTSRQRTMGLLHRTTTKTRSYLQIDQRFPSANRFDMGLTTIEAGPNDVRFRPKPFRRVHEANWTQTTSCKGWHTLFRLYGRFEFWFDKTWRVGVEALLN